MKTLSHSPVFKSFFSAVLLACAAFSQQAQALRIEDTLTGKVSLYPWVAVGGACLTAGDGTKTQDGKDSSIPACVGLPYYAKSPLVGGDKGNLGATPSEELKPDPDGKGALRLTNGGAASEHQLGAVVSKFVFPSNEGVKVTFSTATYGGRDGADGLTFMLLDASKSPEEKDVSRDILGSTGGALGYTCANIGRSAHVHGTRGGYLGIGIDEWGNFSNKVDTTSSGNSGGTKNRIVIRGAGETNAVEIYKKYEINLSDENIRKTCASGKISKDLTKTTEDVPVLNYELLTMADIGRLGNQNDIRYTSLRSKAIPIVFQIHITEDGKLNIRYKYSGGATKSLISNKDIVKDYKNPKLPANFRFAFAATTGGSSNVHEITCFKAEPAAGSSSSAASNMPMGEMLVGTQAFLANTRPIGVWGQLIARDVILDDTQIPAVIQLRNKANWDANCVLTGTPLWAAIGDSSIPKDTCEATQAALKEATPPNERNLLTWNGSQGVSFRWDNLGSFEQSALNAVDNQGEQRLAYLRGERSKEVSYEGGVFRTRTGILGDVSNTSPVLVSQPSKGYKGEWRNKLYNVLMPENTREEGAKFAYDQFAETNALRTHVVFLGSNDGFIHGFRAGKSDVDGSLNKLDNDGRELIAYMPASVLSTIHGNKDKSNQGIHPELDFSGTTYERAYFIDATPGTNDLYYGGAWHTWLVGGLGAGGNYGGAVSNNNEENGGLDPAKGAAGAIYALDVTDPDSFNPENAAAIVKGDWNAQTLKCENDADCGRHLGNTHGTPVIRRLHNGHWAAIFGNGLHSKSGRAGIYVMKVDNTSGAITFRFVETDPANTSANKNGIVHVTAADMDGDRVTDYVYAGDILGNVWRFDLTSKDEIWTSKKLFTTDGGKDQPITSQIAASTVFAPEGGGKKRLMLAFGTGQKFPRTLTSGEAYLADSLGKKQALYGIWDWDLKDWNTKNSLQYHTLDKAPTNPTLQKQILSEKPTAAGEEAQRKVTNNKVCWAGSLICAGGNNANTALGWKIDLPGKDEQIIYNPTTETGLFTVNTTIPEGIEDELSCVVAKVSGYTLALTVDEGRSPQISFFDPLQKNPETNTVGVSLGAVGTPVFVKKKDGKGRERVYMINQSANVTKQGIFGSAREVFLQRPGLRAQRETWRQLR